MNFSPILCALAHHDGTLRKNAKCQLAKIIEKLVNVVPRLEASPENTVYILDGMAFVQMKNSGGAPTFGELAAKYYRIFSSPLSTRKYSVTVFTLFLTSTLRFFFL